MDEREARAAVVEAGKRLVASGLIARTWGNVSARISDTQFVITPTGREYVTLREDEVVPVAISDLSYTGSIKPSGERGVHAEIYKAHPDANFVIHTHQENASIVAATDVDAIHVGPEYPELTSIVLSADYGLPGTKKIREAVGKAVRQSAGHAIIMKNHGAVCFGANADEAFQAALDLEQACWEAITSRYQQNKQLDSLSEDKMRQCALTGLAKPYRGKQMRVAPTPHFSSERTTDGFILHEPSIDKSVMFDQSAHSLSPEAALHLALYKRHKNIHFIVPAEHPDVLAVSRANVTMEPLIDDFAQIVGPHVKTAFTVDEAASALRSSSAVLVAGSGALCCGGTEEDATAVQMIVEKNCKALLYGPFLGNLRPIGKIDRALQRVVYRVSYSRRLSSNV